MNSRAPAFVELEAVSRRFGSVLAVSEVDLRLQAGRILGLMGSDGAGKSTLLRMLATTLTPSEGTVRVDGLDAARDRDRVKPLIGYMPQRFGLYLDLTVEENIDFFLDVFSVFGRERRERKERYLGFSNLTPFKGRLARDLSGGMKQKLGLACVLVHHPKLLVLDEPTNGVDPVSRREFWDILADMRKEGLTIVVSTAYLEEGELCDRLALMHLSRVIGRGTPDEIRGRHPSLEEAMISRIQDADQGGEE